MWKSRMTKIPCCLREKIYFLLLIVAAFFCVGAQSQEAARTSLAAANATRAAHNRPPLAADAALDQVAALRAREVAARFAHQRPDGRGCFTALKDAGIRYESAGENLARGQALTADEAVRLWLDSPSHRRNLLRREFDAVGIGCYTAPDSIVYWAQIFIRHPKPR